MKIVDLPNGKKGVYFEEGDVEKEIIRIAEDEGFVYVGTVLVSNCEMKLSEIKGRQYFIKDEKGERK